MSWFPSVDRGQRYEIRIQARQSSGEIRESPVGWTNDQVAGTITVADFARLGEVECVMVIDRHKDRIVFPAPLAAEALIPAASVAL